MTSNTHTIPKVVAVGIGRAIALQLADDGYAVAANDIEGKQDLLKGLVEEITAKGGSGKVYTADISQEQQVDGLVADVVEAFGGIDVFVANAGIIKELQPVTETTVEHWDRVMSVNARGTFLCFRAAGRQMVKQGRGGRIIGASSVAGKQAIAEYAVYSASKFAVRGLTQALAQELGPHGITVKYVGERLAPMISPFRTPQIEYGMSLKARTTTRVVGLVQDLLYWDELALWPVKGIKDATQKAAAFYSAAEPWEDERSAHPPCPLPPPHPGGTRATLNLRLSLVAVVHGHSSSPTSPTMSMTFADLSKCPQMMLVAYT
ncbi:NAD-binding protein [Mycena kentingensis (nom. inval.)]|nr:NAD-binding protein [Mycena kentingensis (nom. inval.)]